MTEAAKTEQVGRYAATMEIIDQKLITNPYDILDLDIIDFNRLNGVWKNSGAALRTIFSWFNQMAVVTIVDIFDFYDAPERDDWPGWRHVGGHKEIGETFWNWFFWKHPTGQLTFSDSPDFFGDFGGASFWGDVGKVSASTFALTQKGLHAHDLWISVLGNGHKQVMIEPLVDIVEMFPFFGSLWEETPHLRPAWARGRRTHHADQQATGAQ